MLHDVVEQCDELDLLDYTIKKFTRPVLEVDTSALVERQKEIKVEREDLLRHLGVTKDQLTSDAKFAELLIQHGMPPEEVPTKWSIKQKKKVYAFAKSDPGFIAIQFDLKWALLCKARLMFKSTQEETRTKRLKIAAEAAEWKFGRPLLAVPIKYYGAHTGRFSGLDKLNLQNLGRKSRLRKAIVAPPGHKILAGDLSQIEARLVATVAGQWDLVDLFAAGEDVYAHFASDHYGYKVHKDTHEKERFVGKTGILSLGFQAGHNKFHATMNFVFNTEISEREALRVVESYRRRYKQIVELWYRMEDMIRAMSKGMTMKIKPVMSRGHSVILPNGMKLNYPDLRKQDGRWVFTNSDGHPEQLYGGKLLENVIQALARIVVTTAELRLARAGLRAALSVHDELVYCVKEAHAPRLQEAVQRVMSRRVEWLPELPVAAEVKFGDNYGAVK